MGLDLHIEELVLHGFAPQDRHAIADAVQLELSRMLSATARQDGAREFPARLDGGTFQVKAGARPQTTGREIARAVFRSLRPQAGAAGASAGKGGRRT